LAPATDSVYKSPGPIQRALLRRAYKKFLVHESLYSPQSPIQRALTALTPTGEALCSRHCNTRVAQNVKVHHGPTLDHPPSHFNVQYSVRTQRSGLADFRIQPEDHSIGFGWPCTTPGTITTGHQLAGSYVPKLW